MARASLWLWMTANASCSLRSSPSARDKLRRVLILDQPDRDAIALDVLRYGDANSDGCADIIDMLTMYPAAWRNVVRPLPELDAAV